MKNGINHGFLTLSQSGFGAIHRCRCGGYHLNLRNVNLHFTREEFIALADLFMRAEERDGDGTRFSLREESEKGI